MRYILYINTRNFRKQLNINKYEVKLHPLSNIEKQYMNVHVEIFKIYKLIYTRLLYVKKKPSFWDFRTCFFLTGQDDKGNLLEFIMKMYCQFYEVEIDIGCPTRFRLPEPSNMRHAAQVSQSANTPHTVNSSNFNISEGFLKVTIIVFLQVSFDSIHESLATLHAELRSFQDTVRMDNNPKMSN